MDKIRLGTLLTLLALTCAGTALGATVWRSPFGAAYSVAVNSADGTVWAATGGSVMHLTAAGDIISQTDGFYQPRSLAVNPTDGSCWVADDHILPIGAGQTEYGAVVHLAADGTEVWRNADFSHPTSVAVYPTDGSCWVTDGVGAHHLAADGTLLQYRGGSGFQSVAVDPTDGTAWVADAWHGTVRQFLPDGTEHEYGGDLIFAGSVAVNPADGSCWVADYGSAISGQPGDSSVSHYSAIGALLWRGGDLRAAASLAVDPTDGSVWVVDMHGAAELPYNSLLVHLAANGTELWRGAEHPGSTSDPYGDPYDRSVAVAPSGGPVWVADSWGAQVIRLDRTGTEQRFGPPFAHPLSIAVSLPDGSCWVGGGARLGDPRGALVHLSPIGLAVLWTGLQEMAVTSIAVDPSDGSCWAAAHTGDQPSQVIHVSREGLELWRGDFGYVQALAVNPSDGSCWIADTYPYMENGAVVHLSAEGVELWRGAFPVPVAVAVDPTDGSCRVAAAGADQVLNLAADGSELWRHAFPGEEFAWDLAVNPTDGSCWVAAGDLALLSAGGGELWRGRISDQGSDAVAVDPWDGSCWARASISGSPYERVYRVQTDGRIVERVTGFLSGHDSAWHPIISVNPRDGSCWVADEYHGQVVHLNAGCAPFRDVPCDYWALAYILACYNAGLVNGYGDYTYRPEQTVSRAAMAVYVARALAGGDALVPSGPSTASFPDVATTYWAFKYVEYCHDQGVVGGYADGYRPEEIVNRAQMAVYVARALAGGDSGVPAGPGTATFPDVSTTHWAFKYVEYCKAQGVVGGYPDGTYHPNEAVNRAQMAVYVARAFGLV